MEPAGASGSTRNRAADVAARAASLQRKGDWDAVAGLYQDAFQQATAAGDAEQATRALIGHGWALARKGRLRQAEELAREGISLAEHSGLPGPAAHATNLLASVFFFRSDFPAAAELYADARDRADLLGDDLLVGSTSRNLGNIANIRGDFREARALYLESIGAVIRADNKEGAMLTYLNLGKACVCLEDWLEAEVYFDRGIEIAQEIGDVPMGARLHANLAVPLIHTGEYGRARTALDRAAQLATRILDTETLSHTARLHGAIARLHGDFAAAREHLADALRFATGPGCDIARAEALEEQGQIALAEGKLTEASDVFAEARSCYGTLGAEHDVARMEALLERCNSEIGV